jgi:predicted secreted protein with PEFG-CTERM motif
MMRVELRDMIKNGAPVSEVSAQIDKVLLKMDEVAVIVPEFGQIAAMILIAGLIGSIVIFSKSKNLIRIPRI